MKKKYEKPVAEIIDLTVAESIADEEGGNYFSSVEGIEPW